MLPPIDVVQVVTASDVTLTLRPAAGGSMGSGRIVERATAGGIENALLGGAANRGTDRDAAALLEEIVPSYAENVRGQRAFTGRAVRYALDQGVEQIIDLGVGLLSPGAVHEVAQAAHWPVRVAVVESDPTAAEYGRRRLAGHPDAEVVYADPGDSSSVLASQQLRRLLDLSRPVALLAVGAAPFLPDAAAVFTAYGPALAPGSYLAVAQWTPEGLSLGQAARVAAVYAATATPIVFRSHAQTSALFGAFALEPPGVVPASEWRPEILEHSYDTRHLLAGVGRLNVAARV